MLKDVAGAREAQRVLGRAGDERPAIADPEQADALIGRALLVDEHVLDDVVIEGDGLAAGGVV